jgi:ribosomal protein S1
MSEQIETQNEIEVGNQVSGRVKHLGMYGALVDIGTGLDAMLHISQLAQDESRAFEEVVHKGDEITAYILKTRKDGHVALTMEKPPEVPWQTIKTGGTYTGTVIRIENFGVFVDFGAERPGMVHVSEMADGYVKSPNDVVSVGDEVEVRVINKKGGRSRQIDLSMKSEPEEIEVFDEQEEELPTSMAQAFRRAMEGQEDETEDDRQAGKKSGKRNAIQDGIIARTLGNSNS